MNALDRLEHLRPMYRLQLEAGLGLRTIVCHTHPQPRQTKAGSITSLGRVGTPAQIRKIIARFYVQKGWTSCTDWCNLASLERSKQMTRTPAQITKHILALQTSRTRAIWQSEKKAITLKIRKLEVERHGLISETCDEDGNWKGDALGGSPEFTGDGGWGH
jgi:hypothetical protein